MTFRPQTWHGFLIPLRSRNRRLLIASGSAILLLIALLVILLLVKDQDTRVISTDLIGLLISMLMVFVLIQTAFRFKDASRIFYLFWLLLGIGQFLNVLGELTWLVYELVLHLEPYPSPADLFYLLSYPVTAAGLMMLPGIPGTRRAFLKTVIDIAIFTFTAAIIYWNFLLGPLVEIGYGQDPLTLALSLAYPIADLILLVVWIIMIYRLPRLGSSLPLWILVSGLLAAILADTVFSYETMVGTYMSGAMLDLLWPLSYILMIIAAVVCLTHFYEQPDRVFELKTGLWRKWMY